MNKVTIADILNMTIEKSLTIEGIDLRILELDPLRYNEKLKGNIQNGKATDSSGKVINFALFRFEDMSKRVGKSVLVENVMGPKGPTVTASLDKFNNANKISIFAPAKITDLAPLGPVPIGVAGGSNAITVNGAKVGMAINCATELVSSGVMIPRDDVLIQIWEIASELIRVSCRLESGDLAPEKDPVHGFPVQEEPARPPKKQPVPANPDEDVPF